MEVKDRTAGQEVSRRLKPLNDCVLIDPEPPPEYQDYKRYQHIVVPEKWAHGPEDRPVWGTVIAAGEQCTVHLVTGTRVVFGKWAGARVKYEEREYILVRDYDILALDE